MMEMVLYSLRYQTRQRRLQKSWKNSLRWRKDEFWSKGIKSCQEELKAAEKAEKEAAEKAQMDEIVKAVKKSGKSPEEIMTLRGMPAC